jgi:hypothetical protein
MSFNHAFSRRAFLKGLGTAALAAPFISTGLIAKPRSSVLRHASFGSSGMAMSDILQITRSPNVELVAVADVDLARTGEVRKRFPQARVYQDWRRLLDKEHKNLDSVNVSTPDHMHAPIAIAAMERGKHVYAQKPLAHEIAEVRDMMQVARRRNLVTQMGIQIHSTSHYQMAVLLVQAGAIGKIKEVHSWCPKSWGDPKPLPDRNDPVPEGLDWDLWLGVCADRPYIGNAYYHPNNWRNRLDFGTGTMGDMGCHIFDPVFKGLKISAPISVRSDGPAPNQWNWAIDSRIEFVFPGSRFTAGDTIKVTWYDGASKPPAEILALLEGDELPNTGSIFVGAQGTMMLPHVNRPLLYPDKKFQDFKYPEVPSLDHWGSFVQACLGNEPTSAHFDYSGPLTEAVLLGCIATRFPQTTLNWHSGNGRFSQEAANAFLRREYRAGWKGNYLT